MSEQQPQTTPPATGGPTGEAILETVSLTKIFGGLTAVDAVSFTDCGPPNEDIQSESEARILPGRLPGIYHSSPPQTRQTQLRSP